MQMRDVHEYIDHHLNLRIEENKLRDIEISSARVDFSSNDYLGFSNKKELIELLKYSRNVGSTSSRLISGTSTSHIETESMIADFHGSESALLFNSGYTANLGLISSIGDRHSVFVYDELCHASIIDGMRLSKAKRHKFKHNNTESLKGIIENIKDERLFIIVESVYSMDGDLAPLEKIMELAIEFDAELIVDEAHALGVFGGKGEGLCPSNILGKDVFARVYTYGKALGLHGAAVVSKRNLHDFLVNFSRPFIYTTAMPSHQAELIAKAYSLLPDAEERSFLKKNIFLFSRVAEKFNRDIKMVCNPSAIQYFPVSGNLNARNLNSELIRKGFETKSILSPTVREGEERIRICLHSFNTESEINSLFVSLSASKS